MNTSVGSPVPSIIWDAFTDVLEANTLRLCKEVAQALGVSHLPLMTAIKAKKIHPYIVEMADDQREIDMRCDFVCQCPTAPLYQQTCAEPIVWNASVQRCPQHLYSKQKPRRALRKLRKIQDSDMYISEDGTLYDDSDTAIGSRLGSVQLRFEVE